MKLLDTSVLVVIDRGGIDSRLKNSTTRGDTRSVSLVILSAESHSFSLEVAYLQVLVALNTI